MTALEIARALTAKERKLLAGFPDGEAADRNWATSGTTLASLCLWSRKRRPGLPQPIALLSRRFDDDHVRYVYSLTETGRAVRQELRSKIEPHGGRSMPAA